MLKHDKSQKGFAHVTIVAVIVLVAAVGGIGYYVYSKSKNSSTASVSPQQAASDKALIDACNNYIKDKDFCKFAGNWSMLENYKSTITTTSKEGTSVMIIETENDDKMKTTTSQNGTEFAAYVTIGKDFYTKDITDGKWTKLTDDSPATSAKSSFKNDIEISDFQDTGEEDKTTYKLIGKEPCGKVTCFKYQIIDAKELETEQFIWFDTKDYQLRRLLSKSPEGSSDMVISYSNVKVSVPSPVKSASTSSQTEADVQKQVEDAMRATNNSAQEDPGTIQE